MTHAYNGMPEGEFVPSPQQLRDVRMIIVGYQADKDVLRSVLPDGLEPHPDGGIQMNMYKVPDGRQTSHMDSFTLTYLTVELADHDARCISRKEGEFPVPGRYWVGYWNSSSKMQTFVREAGGIPSQHGTTSWSWEGDNLTSTLEVDGRDVITLEAEAANPEGEDFDQIDRITGHLNYHSRRQIPSASGGEAEIDELVHFPIPIVFNAYSAEVKDVVFDFPEDHHAAKLAPTEPLEVHEVLYGDNAFVYPQGRVIEDYTNDE